MASSQYSSDCDEFKPYSPPSVVDCTLSLGTPSTRRTSPSSPCNTNDSYDEHHRHSGGSSSNFFSSLQSQYSSSSTSTYYGTAGHHTIISNNHTGTANASSGGNPPAFRRCCTICHTISTPLWRKGPKGPKTLCNACGIRFMKVEKRAKEAAAATDPVGGGGMGSGKATKPERGSITSGRRRNSQGNSGIQENSPFLGSSTSETGPLPSSSTSLSPIQMKTNVSFGGLIQ